MSLEISCFLLSMLIIGCCFVLLVFAPNFGTRGSLFSIPSGDSAFALHVELTGTSTTSGFESRKYS